MTVKDEELDQLCRNYKTLDNDKRKELVREMVRKIIDATQIEASGLTKLAVVPVDQGDTIDPRIADTLAQILSINFIRSGKYAVYPRTQSLEQVKAEYKNQLSGRTADKNIVAIGKGENPRFVLSVAARRLGTANMFNASIIDLESGVQTVGKSVNYTTLDDGITAMENLAQELTGVSRIKPSDDPAIGKKLGIGAMNMALGLGSFTQGDWKGGLTLLGGYGIAGGLIAWELSLNYEDDLAGIPGAAGLGVAGITVAYGFIRPWIYKKNPAVASVTDKIQVTIIPDRRGFDTVYLSYTFSF